MDLETATDAVDGGFDAFGVDGVYTSPVDVTADCRAIPWSPKDQRRSQGHSFGGVEIAARAMFLLVRKSELAAPVSDGVFVLGAAGGEGTFRIGEDAPIDHDTRGLVWRCAVTRED